MFERYAIFYTPPEGALARFGASWLGWDSACGKAVAQPQLPGHDVAALTATPRKYGFHATLKAPFRLAPGADAAGLVEAGLVEAVRAFAARTAAVRLQGLALRCDHGFVALRPVGEATALRSLAGNIVRTFDGFRAPLTGAEIAKRRKSRLTARQDRQMLEWGYPYIFEDFHFHMTLSGATSEAEGAALIAALAPLAATPVPFDVDAITLMGQDEKGMFHQISRSALAG